MSKEFHQTYLNESDTRSLQNGELNIPVLYKTYEKTIHPKNPIELFVQTEKKFKPRLHITICSWRLPICAMGQTSFFFKFFGGDVIPPFIGILYFMDFCKKPLRTWVETFIPFYGKQWEFKTRSHICKGMSWNSDKGYFGTCLMCVSMIIFYLSIKICTCHNYHVHYYDVYKVYIYIIHLKTLKISQKSRSLVPDFLWRWNFHTITKPKQNQLSDFDSWCDQFQWEAGTIEIY